MSVKIWNSSTSSFVEINPKVYNGTEWVETNGYIHNGTEWVNVYSCKKESNLIDGKAFNTAIKKLVISSSDYSVKDNTITSIRFVKGNPDKINGVKVDNEGFTYATYDSSNTTVTITTSSNELYSNEDCSNMFSKFDNLSTLNLSLLMTDKTCNMNGMFSYCNLDYIDLSNFNTSNVTNMASMFYNCYASSLNLSSFNTSNVTNMANMFGGCSSLYSLDLSNFNTSKATRMDYMLQNCGSMVSLNLSSFEILNASTDNMISSTDAKQSLQTLYCPKLNNSSSIYIGLSKTAMYDRTTGTSYRYIPTTTGTSVTLYSTP